ncbi:hypothetical protein [uncultured Serinicoccus sp.]|uniref:hypothetical protein n=1 Tax=uncultured Serinicoccus sp. TaxID=735514 RepID=UPI002626BBD5|nr:hypothetical protein [uncultured Serinicoccus sp.]
MANMIIEVSRTVGKVIFDAYGPIGRVFLDAVTLISESFYRALFGTEPPTRGTDKHQASQRPDRGAELDSALLRLARAGGDATALIEEIESEARERQRRIQHLQNSLKELSDEEAKLKQRVSALQDADPKAAEIFANLIREDLDLRGRSDRRRDWLIFMVGCFFSAVISVVVGLLL